MHHYSSLKENFGDFYSPSKSSNNLLVEQAANSIKFWAFVFPAPAPSPNLYLTAPAPICI